MILILTADIDDLEYELSLLFDDFVEVKGFIAPMYMALINDRKVIFAELSGTVSTLQLAMVNSMFDITAVILVGTAASLHWQIDRGSIAICNRVYQGKECAPNLIAASERAAFEAGIESCTGTFVSADTFLSNTDKAHAIKSSSKALFLDMECDAISEACAVLNIPFGVIKGVSNYANDKAVCEHLANRCLSSRNALEAAVFAARILAEMP